MKVLSKLLAAASLGVLAVALPAAAQTVLKV
jgi:hypothetical protein